MRRTDALLFPPGAGALSITITDTHNLLRRLFTAGDFLPPQGPRMRGKNTTVKHHIIGLYT